MRCVHRFPGRKCTLPGIMTQSFLAVSLIEITFGTFLPTTQVIQEKVAEVGDGDDLPAWIQHAERLWGCEDGGKQPYKELIPHSGNSESDLTPLSGGEKSMSGDHESKKRQNILDNMSIKGRKPVTVAISVKEQFKLIIQEYKTLESDSIRWATDIRLITISSGRTNAYQILEKIYKEVNDQLQVWYGKKTLEDSEEVFSVFDLCNELQWKIMAKTLQHSLNDFEDLLANRDIPSANVAVAVYYHPLEVQVFNILNFLLKNKLVERDAVKDWINRENVLKAIQNHIIEMCTTSNFFGPDLIESLKKSKSTQHLGALFDLIDDRFWKVLEFRSFHRRLFENVKLQERCETSLRFLITEFESFKFAETIFEPSQKMKELMKELVNYFDSFELSTVFRWNIFDHGGIVYEMIYLLMKYHTKTFLENFKNRNDSHIFLQKIKMINYAIPWLKSSRERYLVARFGFWTTEGYFKQSRNLISLEDAQVLSKSLRSPDKYIKDDFSLDLPWDFSEWIMRAKKATVQENNGLWRLAKLVPESISKGELTLEPVPSTMIAHKNLLDSHVANTPSKKWVSRIFLKEAYSWSMNLKLLQKRFRAAEDQYMSNINKIAFNGDDPVSQHLKSWVVKSLFMISLHGKVFEDSKESQISWNRLKLKLEEFNQEYLSSRPELEGEDSIGRDLSRTDSDSIKNIGDELTQKKYHENSSPGFYIPKIRFTTKA